MRLKNYKWKNRKESASDQENAVFLAEIIRLYSGKKTYLSAILNLADNSVVSYALGHSGNNLNIYFFTIQNDFRKKLKGLAPFEFRNQTHGRRFVCLVDL